MSNFHREKQFETPYFTINMVTLILVIIFVYFALQG